MELEPRRLPWAKVTWENTHLEGMDERDLHHVGRDNKPSDGDVVILRLGSDDDEKPHFTIVLTQDQAQDLAAMLRMAAR